MTEEEVFFVARLKSNAMFRAVTRQPVVADNKSIGDQVVKFAGIQTVKQRSIWLHHIGYQDPDADKHYVFITDNFRLSINTVADIYKAYWRVE